MKKIVLLILTLLFVLIFPTTTLAEIQSTGWTGHGLYLLQDNNIHLNQVDINIIINEDQTANVDAKYELENKDDKTVNVYFGVPEQDVELLNFTSRVLPYLYGNRKESGSSINKGVKDLNTNYKSWRTWYSPFKPGEKRIAEFTYKVDNKYISDGRYLISFQMDHINSWKGSPDSINVSVQFDNREVKVYNFGNEFSMLPEVGEDFTLEWSFDTIEGNESVDFDYFSVDHEIIKFLKSSKSSRINKIVSAYGEKNYTEVIQLSKEYIQSPEGDELLKEVYFLMADAYQNNGQPEESLIVYELIEEDPGFYEGIQEKVQHIITYNKINSYLNNQDYKPLYRLLVQVQDDNSYSFIFQNWAKRLISDIPQEEIDSVIEEDRVPVGLEKLKLEIYSGKYNTYIIIIVGTLLILFTSLHNIKKKKRDKKFLFRK